MKILVVLLYFANLKSVKIRGELSERQHFQSVCITIGGGPRQGGKVFVTVNFMIYSIALFLRC